MNRTTRTALTAVAFSLLVAQAPVQAQGVTDSEVLIGSNQDMSGIFAAFGAPAVNAANQYINKVNADGGVHGRQIKLIVEDHAYQLPKAMQNLNKLVNSDKVFAMFMSLGTPMNVAAFKLQHARKVANVSPLSAARQLLEGPIDYKYSPGISYYSQIKSGITYLQENFDSKTVCSMFLPTDFGKEIQEGGKDVAAELGIAYGGETTHKPDEADFVGSLTKLKAANCDIIGVALGVRQVITAVATAKKMGWTDVTFIGASASFHTAVATVPGGVTNGFYAAAGWQDLEGRMDVPEVADFYNSYKEAYGDAPGTGALLGRSYAENLVRALEASGKDLNPESFRLGMESLNYEDKVLGIQMSYSADDHEGGDAVIVSQIVDGSWKTLKQ
jgi:branched-chain amino acid transport system substrate-binding protein